MKLKRKNIVHLSILFGAYLLLVLCLTRFKYAYGSTLDWGGQHYAIPDYFRKLFYDTGELFPSFAPNIGAGENIYNLSYYGLFSPLILFSYLLPFVKMSTYIQAVSILGVIAGTFIFYQWMRRKFEDNTAFLLAAMYMFSGSVIFHSHRHIMFVSYLPFLMLAMISAEDYFSGKKKYKLVLFTFLTIMTNYFFAVSGIVAITVYAVYCYLKTTEKFVFKDFVKSGLAYAGRIITAVFMSGILILPTVYCLLSGRDSGNVNIDWKIFLPGIHLSRFQYNHYSLGLGAFVVCAIVSAVISKEKHRRFLGFAMALPITFPFFIYLFNGTLYVDAKVMIPFLPVFLVVVGDAYTEILEGKFRWKIIMPVTAVYIAAGLFNYKKSFIVIEIIDLVLLFVCFFVFLKKNKKAVLNLGIAGMLVAVNVSANFTDELVNKNQIEKDTGNNISALADIVLSDENIVRTANRVDPVNTANYIYNADFYSADIYSSLHNKKYNRFYFDKIYNENEFRNSALTTQPQNILSQIYMSQKYLITDKDSAPAGYKKIKENGGLYLYENDRVMPFGYATDRLMSEEQYNRLEYPYSIEVLMNYIIVPKAPNRDFNTQIKTQIPVEFQQSNELKEENGVYEIEAKEEFRQTVKLDKPLSNDQILLLKFNVDNDLPGEKKDAKVTVNGIGNKLTDPTWKYYNNNASFEYAITSEQNESIDRLEFKFSKGHYKISDIRCYVMDYPKCAENVDPFIADKERTKGDKIVGSIDVSEDGYFNLSVPYSEGFSIKIDGVETKCETVDTSFVGFKISKGKHNVEITFKSPLRKEGIILSLTGLVIFVIMTLFEFIGNKKRKQ